MVRTRKDGSTENIMDITFPDPSPATPKVPCPKCHRLFFSNQGLGVHVKTDHKDDVRIGVTRWCSTARAVVDPPSTLPWSGVPSGRCWRVTFHHQASGLASPAGSVTFVLQRDGVDKDTAIGDGFPAPEKEAPKKTRGADHRRQYDPREKLSVVEQLRELESRAQEVPTGFVNGQVDSWDQTGAARVHIMQPFPGLEKRQCTVQPTFGPGGKVMKCAIIFRGKGTGISKVEKAAYDKRVVVFFQPKAWADNNFCMQWLERCFRPSLMAASGGKVPDEQTVLLADNLHGQTSEKFREYLYKECNTLLWLLPAGCTDELQPVDAGMGRRMKTGMGRQLDSWLEHGENLQQWEDGTLTASERRVLMTRWVAEVIEEINADQEYRFRLFDKTGAGMTADGSGDERINLEGMSGPLNFMDADVGGSSGEEDEEERKDDSNPGKAGRGGEDLGLQLGGDNESEEDASSCDESDGDDDKQSEDPLTQLHDDDQLCAGEESLEMDVPDGFQLQASPPSALDQSLVERGLGWFGGVISRRAHPASRGEYDYRVILNSDGSTQSMKLPLESYSTDENAGVGSWVLLEVEQEEARIRKSRRATTPNVRHSELPT
eukprot:g19348.t1